MPEFQLAGIPRTVFQQKAFKMLPQEICARNDQQSGEVLLITGGFHKRYPERWKNLLDGLKNNGMNHTHHTVAGEPGPETVDTIVDACRYKQIGVVAAIGGGSVLDAGKAISAMLTKDDSVIYYLEGVGDGRKHDGDKIPFVAVPTTAGTGSEATKNAVLGEVGENGFKNSLRHDRFVPEAAVIDPELMLDCPPSVTMASGLDAFTQLLESYTSTKATVFTDSLAQEAIRRAGKSLTRAYSDGSDINARSDMAYAAYISGITLANAGLGVVHGFASAISRLVDIPHGVICASLVAPATRKILTKLEADHYSVALSKYAWVGNLLAGHPKHSVSAGIATLRNQLAEWQQVLNVPELSDYGVQYHHVERIVQKTGLKNTPAQLDEQDLKQILEEQLS